MRKTPRSEENTYDLVGLRALIQKDADLLDSKFLMLIGDAVHAHTHSSSPRVTATLSNAFVLAY